MHRVRVLVVEDERRLAQAPESALTSEHYEVVVARTGEDGFFRANDETFDVVILDLMLPGRSGLEIQALPGSALENPADPWLVGRISLARSDHSRETGR